MKRKPKKLITIRLGKSLIDDLKKIAKIQGVRYQTLINQILHAEVDAEGCREGRR